MNHHWPEDYEEHVWGPWLWAIGLPNEARYRKCVHPECTSFEYETKEQINARSG